MPLVTLSGTVLSKCHTYAILTYGTAIGFGPVPVPYCFDMTDVYFRLLKAPNPAEIPSKVKVVPLSATTTAKLPFESYSSYSYSVDQTTVIG